MVSPQPAFGYHHPPFFTLSSGGQNRSQQVHAMNHRVQVEDPKLVTTMRLQKCCQGLVACSRESWSRFLPAHTVQTTVCSAGAREAPNMQADK